MKTNAISLHIPRLLFALTAAVSLSACAKQTPGPQPVTPASAQEKPVASPAAQTFPLIVVHKSASCGCCGSWVEHMRKASFAVEVRDQDDINPLKERLGVPDGKASCHTAEVGGYFIEGHVPAEDVKRLLTEKPDAKGLVLPGMPMGSPGMEMPDGRTQPYTVELVHKDGSTSAFANH